MLLFSFSLSLSSRTALDNYFGPPARSSDHLKHCTERAVRSGLAYLPQIMLLSDSVELIGKVPWLRRSYNVFSLTLLVKFLTPLSLFTFTQSNAGMLVLSTTIRLWQFAKPRGRASLVDRNRFTFPPWWYWSLILALIESSARRMSNLVGPVNLTLTLLLSYWDGENLSRSLEGSQQARTSVPEQKNQSLSKKVLGFETAIWQRMTSN